MAESSKKTSDPDDDERDDDERDDDERDDDERDDDEQEPSAPAKAPNVAGAASGEAASSSAEDEDEDDAPPPQAAPAKKAALEGAPKPKKKKKRASEGGDRPKPVAAQRVAPRQAGALGKSLILFLIVVGGLAAGFFVLGRDTDQKAPAAPKWAVGQTVDVEITLVPTDNKDLACASKEEINGRHCQFEERNKVWKAGDPDEKILKPYTTTDRVQFLAAGLWDQPSLKGGKLPVSRFSVKCKYKVEGKLPKPWIRWASDGQWFERNDDWYAGPVTDCTVVQ